MKFAAVLALSGLATAAALPGAVCAIRPESSTEVKYLDDGCDFTKEFCSHTTLKCTTYIAHDAVCGVENAGHSPRFDERGVCVDTDLCMGKQPTDKCVTLPKLGETCIKVTDEIWGGNTCGPVNVTPLVCDYINATSSGDEQNQLMCKQRGQADGSHCYFGDSRPGSSVCAGWCDSSERKCKPYGKAGDACDSSMKERSFECLGRCDPTGKCVNFKLEGAACEVNDECCPYVLVATGGCGCKGTAPNRVCGWGTEGFAAYKSDCGKTANWAAEEERCEKFESTADICNAAGGCFYCTTGEPRKPKCQWAPAATCKVEMTSRLIPGPGVVTTYSKGVCKTEAPITLSGAGSVAPALALFAALSAAAAAFSQ